MFPAGLALRSDHIMVKNRGKSVCDLPCVSSLCFPSTKALYPQTQAAEEALHWQTGGDISCHPRSISSSHSSHWVAGLNIFFPSLSDACLMTNCSICTLDLNNLAIFL